MREQQNQQLCSNGDAENLLKKGDAHFRGCSVKKYFSEEVLIRGGPFEGGSFAEIQHGGT